MGFFSCMKLKCFRRNRKVAPSSSPSSRAERLGVPEAALRGTPDLHARAEGLPGLKQKLYTPEERDFYVRIDLWLNPSRGSPEYKAIHYDNESPSL